MTFSTLELVSLLVCTFIAGGSIGGLVTAFFAGVMLSRAAREEEARSPWA